MSKPSRRGQPLLDKLLLSLMPSGQLLTSTLENSCQRIATRHGLRSGGHSLRSSTSHCYWSWAHSWKSVRSLGRPPKYWGGWGPKSPPTKGHTQGSCACMLSQEGEGRL